MRKPTLSVLGRDDHICHLTESSGKVGELGLPFHFTVEVTEPQ